MADPVKCCPLSDWANVEQIQEDHLASISAYRAALGSLADDLDTCAEVEHGILQNPNQIYARSTALRDDVLG